MAHFQELYNMAVEQGKQDDKKTLSQFLWCLRDFMEQIVEEQMSDDRGPLLVPELHESARRAWLEVEPAFKQMDEALSGITLEPHGLHGQQLAFKLRTIAFAEQRWADTTTAGQELGNGVYAWPWREAFKRLIQAIDTLWDSLVNATRAGALIKEFKDALLDSVDH